MTRHVRLIAFGLALLELPIAIAFVGVRQASAASWYNASWGYRKAITIDHTKVSGGPLTNFPVLINLSSDADLAAHAQSSGNDILFTQSDGTTKMNHEIDGYTSSSGALVAFVQVPSLSSTADTVIYMYFGNGGAANQQNATAVWDANFTGVYHFGNLTSLNANDSTSNARNGTITGATAGTGQINGAASYTSTNKIATGVALSSFIANNLGTMEAWVNASGTAPAVANSYLGQLIVGDPASGGGFAGLVRANVGGSDRIWAYTWDGAEKKVGLTYTAGTWVHMVWVHTGGNLLGYANGSLVTSVAAANTSTMTGTVNIGSNDDTSGTNYFNGLLDEVRISNVARSAGWIATEYNNENSPSTFYSRGSATTNTATWTGAVSNLWSNGGNWSGIGGVAPSAGNDLVFPGGASNLSTSNDLTAGTSFNSITLSGSGYTLAGNSVAVGTGSISATNSSGTNTISLVMTSSSTPTFTVSSGGTLIVGSAVGGSAGLTKTGAGTLTVNGSSAYTGATTIGAGTLKFGATNPLPSGSAVTVTGTLDLGGFAGTIGSLSGGGTVTDSSATAATLTAGGDNTSTTFSGVIQNGSGTVALTKAGTGTLTLSGSNTYTGVTTINAGTLSIASDGNLGNAPGSATAGQLTFGGGTLATTSTFTLNSNRGIAYTSTGTLDVASGTTLTYGGIAAGAGGMTKTNSGTLSLSGTSTYTGVTTLGAGTVQIIAGTNLGAVPGSPTPGQLVFNGGTLAALATLAINSNRGIAFTATATIDVATGTTFSYGGIAAGAGGLIKDNAGTITLSGANTFSGATTLNAGTTSIAADNNLGAAPGGATAGQLAFNGGTLATTASFTLATNRGIAFTSTGTIDVAPGTTLSYGGVAAGAGGLTKTNAGTLTLSGTSTFTGATTINAGTLSTSKDQNLGAAPGSATPGQLTFAGGTLAATANYTLNAKRGVAFNSTATIDVASAATLTIGGIIAGSGGLTQTNAGALILSGANTYGGATTVSAGTLQLGVANAVPSTSAVTVTGTFELNAFADTIGSLAGAGIVTNNGGADATLTIGADNSSTTFSGVIQDGSKHISIAKTGTGTLTLSGINTYSKGTSINGGVLSISADSGVGGTQAGNIVTFAGGTLATTATFTMASTRPMTFSSTATIDVASGTTLTYGGVASSTGGLTKTSAGTLVLSGTNTYSGATAINAGTVSIAADANLGTAPGSATAGQLTFGGGTLATTATFTLNSKRGIAFTSTGTIDVASATVLTYGGIAAGANGLIKTSAGTLLLSGANTYSGATNISAGTLKLGVANSVPSGSAVTATGTFDLAGFADAIGSLAGGGTVTSSAAGAITLTSGADNTSTTFSGVIQNGSGTVALTKSGTGTLTLSGTNTYTGTTTAGAGALIVNGSQSGSNVSVNGGAIGGSGTVGTITSTASGGSIAWASATPAILNSSTLNIGTGTPSFVVQLNGTTAGTNYTQLIVSGASTLTNATLSGTVGFTPAIGASFTIIKSSTSITGTFSGLAQGATATVGGIPFTISYTGGTGHDVTLSRLGPTVSLTEAVSPAAMLQSPGTDLAYTTTFTNSGNSSASSFVITDAVPTNTYFKVGSVSNSLGTTGLTVAVSYSNDGGTTWTYTPASGANGAPSGYDGFVTNVKWTFTGSLSQTGPNNTGSVTYTARIK